SRLHAREAADHEASRGLPEEGRGELPPAGLPRRVPAPRLSAGEAHPARAARRRQPGALTQGIAVDRIEGCGVDHSGGYSTASTMLSNSRRPSSPPRTPSLRRSGCGIMPITLPRALE